MRKLLRKIPHLTLAITQGIGAAGWFLGREPVALSIGIIGFGGYLTLYLKSRLRS